MNGFLVLSVALFTVAAVLVLVLNHDTIGACILGGIAAYVAAGMTLPRITPRG